MKKLLLLSLCIFSLNVFSGQLPRVTLLQNSMVKSNQLAFSTASLPRYSSVTVRCSMDNQADFYDYLYVTPSAGSFAGIEHRTCTPSGCGSMSGSKIYLGMADTDVYIYGVSQSNRAIVFTNYSRQNLNIRCSF